MPTYEITDPKGRVLQLEGDHEPTPNELTNIFSQTDTPAPSRLWQPEPFDYGMEHAQKALGSLTEADRAEMQKPMVTLPDLVPWQIKAAAAAAVPGAATVEKVTRGVIAPVKEMAESMTSKVGLAMGPALAGAPELMGPLMGLQSAPGVKAGVEEAAAGVSEGDIEKAVRGASKAGLAAGMVVGGPFALKAGAGAFGRSTPAPEVEVPPILPQTAAAVKETLALPAPGESGVIRPTTREGVGESSGTILAPNSPIAVPTAGHRIELPVEPETAKAARQIWSKPIDVEAQVEGADAIRQLASMTEETKTQGEPYKAPTVNVDLRQLERIMQRNTVSKVESWADEVITRKLGETGANPFLDPEFLAAAMAKGAILFKKGVTKLDEWDSEMRKAFGRGLDAQLPEIYKQTKDYWESKQTTEKGPTNAPQERPVGENIQRERPRNDALGTPAEASTGGSVRNEAQVQQTTTPTTEAPLNEDLFGISQAAREQMSETGRFPYTPPGQGTTAWAEIQRGRELLRKGAYPEQVLADFEKTRRVSADDIAVVRAHMENLFQEAAKIQKEKGIDSPEYIANQQKMTDWGIRTKPMGTEWHAIGMGQQGMTDVNTGDLASMEAAHVRSTGRGFTPKQTKEAADLSGKVKQEREGAQAAQEKVIENIDKDVEAASGKGKSKKPSTPAPPKTPEAALKDARDAVAQAGKDGKFTTDAVRAIWNHAKRSYIERGEANLDAIAQGVADDLGLPKKTVMEIIAGSKGTRRATDEMYLKMSRARQAEAAARAWLINEKSPGWLKWAKKVPSFFFSAKVFGHGTVGMVTHAGALMFDPGVASSYWSNFARQFKLVANAGYHEAMMQDLMHRPNFVKAKRSGLANDPFRFQDDYQNPQIALGLGKFTSMGNRGFDVLKLLRQDLFDRTWDSLDASQKTPDQAKVLSNAINHATGITTGAFLGKLSAPVSVAMFAPKLEGSRWAFAIGDPARAAETFTRWKTASAAERMEAISELKQKTRIAGTYLSLLAINQGLLAAFGSNQEINWNNPHRGDFLAFKGFGMNISVISPMLHMVGLLADLYRIGTSERSKLEKLTPRGEEMGQRIWSYARGKLSPFAQPIVDLATQADFRGRPMPFSEDKVPKFIKMEGYDRYTWPEYITQTLAPIPVAEAMKEVFDSQQMNDKQIETFLKALSVFTVTGGTGIRISPDKRVE